MADGYLYIGDDVYEMRYTTLSWYILKNWKTNFTGKLELSNTEFCGKKEYEGISVWLRNNYLYVWPCDNGENHIVLVSTTAYGNPINLSQYGILDIETEDTQGVKISALITIEQTKQQCYSPCKLTLKAGRYTIIANYEGDKKTIPVTVEANKKTTLKISFKPQMIYLYGQAFLWPKDATHVIAYKIWNPLNIPIDGILAAITKFSTTLQNKGWQLIGVHQKYDVESRDGIIVVWLKETGSISIAAVAALIVVAVIVGVLVYGWVTASSNYKEEYKEYTNTIETEDERLDKQLENGLIDKETYTKLVAIKHKEKPPSSGGGLPSMGDMANMMKWLTGALGVGLVGLLLIKGIPQEVKYKVVNSYESVKGRAINTYSKAKNIALKGLEKVKSI